MHQAPPLPDRQRHAAKKQGQQNGSTEFDATQLSRNGDLDSEPSKPSRSDTPGLGLLLQGLLLPQIHGSGAQNQRTLEHLMQLSRSLGARGANPDRLIPGGWLDKEIDQQPVRQGATVSSWRIDESKTRA